MLQPGETVKLLWCSFLLLSELHQFIGSRPKEFCPAPMQSQRKVLKQQPISWEWGGNLSVLVNHAIKCTESPFKSTAVLPSHGASTGYSCKDLGCEGIYNQFIPTNQWNKNHSVKNTAFPPKHTLLFFLHTHQCTPCVHEAQPVSEYNC